MTVHAQRVADPRVFTRSRRSGLRVQGSKDAWRGECTVGAVGCACARNNARGRRELAAGVEVRTHAPGCAKFSAPLRTVMVGRLMMSPARPSPSRGSPHSTNSLSWCARRPCSPAVWLIMRGYYLGLYVAARLWWQGHKYLLFWQI